MGVGVTTVNAISQDLPRHQNFLVCGRRSMHIYFFFIFCIFQKNTHDLIFENSNRYEFLCAASLQSVICDEDPVMTVTPLVSAVLFLLINVP